MCYVDVPVFITTTYCQNAKIKIQIYMNFTTSCRIQNVISNGIILIASTSAKPMWLQTSVQGKSQYAALSICVQYRVHKTPSKWPQQRHRYKDMHSKKMATTDNARAQCKCFKFCINKVAKYLVVYSILFMNFFHCGRPCIIISIMTPIRTNSRALHADVKIVCIHQYQYLYE